MLGEAAGNRIRYCELLSNNYRGLISCTNSDMAESLPIESENPAGMSKTAALFVTPLGHSLVIMNQGDQQTDYVPENKQQHD